MTAAETAETATETATTAAETTAAETTSCGDDELQRRRAVHLSTPGQKSPKQNRTHGPPAVKHSNPAGFRDLKTLPENFAALRHGTFFHPPVAHKFRRQPIAARVLHAVKAMEERRFGKLSESGDMN